MVFPTRVIVESPPIHAFTATGLTILAESGLGVVLYHWANVRRAQRVVLSRASALAAHGLLCNSRATELEREEETVTKLLTLTAGVALTFSTVGAPSIASAQPTDTTKVSTDPLFTKKDAWIAAGFVAGTIALYPADRYFARKLQTPGNQENRFLRDAASGFRFMGTPGSMIIGMSMYGVGRLAKVDRMADLGLHGTEALLIASNTVGLIKGIAGRARPSVDIEDERSFAFGRGFKKSSDSYRSFPSGHSAMGFAAAAAVTSETSKWWPKSTWYIAPIMYGGATMIAASRMYNNKHWASDVVMGAAIGTFAGTKVVRYHHSHPGNKIDKWLLRPTIQKQPDGTVAVGMAIETR